MAGLGESCSHVASLLFYIEAAVRLREKKTVTGEKAYWMLPSSYKEVPYSEVSNINFSTPTSLKKKFDEFLEGEATETAPVINESTPLIKEPSSEQLSMFFKELSLSGMKLSYQLYRHMIMNIYPIH